MADFEFTALATKPSAQISYSFHAPATTAKNLLIVFINGMGLPQASWGPVIAKLKNIRQETGTPAILTYDRYGQGQTTDRDPDDAAAPDPMHGHDCMSVVKDLRQLITQITRDKLGTTDIDSLSLLLVGNSIGGPLARLYAQEYPGTVAGLLLLDSNIANTDFVSIFPDPDAEGFDPSTLPPGVPLPALRGTREAMRRMFHPSVGSKEGLSRRNLPELLPSSDGPVVRGPDGKSPFVTVVGHDFETFAQEMTQMGAPKSIITTYMNPYWHEYNKGLTKITEPERSKGPLQAPGASHFIQKDNPDFVAQELDGLLSKVF
ncbi:Alpha/Beta hydrolase protein [Aspergillus avenaceus]|uniref:Alpha/Beta hydrolase protein n=1 Tax=Aspergillus avenaceus TaxID=36643 RepID=A0A5N6TW69_ASPAV|nr:Alpha/Beta hydrolase protein [Aspergillus avenaceus]